jgi:hypothetical integral membrane protein (TIGR02206 family)
MVLLAQDALVQPGIPLASPGEHWLFTFRPWDRLHVISFVLGLTVIVGLSWLGLRCRGTPGEDRLRRAWGLWIMATWVAVNVIWLSPWKFDVKTSLPLQICDWAGFWAGLVCLTRWPWARALLYYWGIGLSTQAFFTPTVRHGIDSFDYWQFWINHTQIVSTAFFDVIVRGYRPTWRDWRFTVAVSVVYALVMLGFNMMVEGANYVYVGNVKPKNPTLIDRLGPWPWRVLPMSAIGIGAFAMLTLVWERNWRVAWNEAVDDRGGVESRE